MPTFLHLPRLVRVCRQMWMHLYLNVGKVEQEARESNINKMCLFLPDYIVEEW